MASENAYKLENLCLSRPAILAGFVFLHTQLCMITTLPMDDKLDLVGNHVNYNLFNQQTDYLLARFNACTDAVPGTWEISTKCDKSLAILRAKCNRGVASF